MSNPAKSSTLALSNFAHLQAHDEQLLRLGMLVERYFAEDPNQAAQQLEALQQELKAAKDDQGFWESMAAEAEVEKAALQARLAAKQAEAIFDPPQTAIIVQASAAAATRLELDESAKRTLIDVQLRLAGWTTDSEVLRYSKGARPQKDQNLAIAEWPTATGPGDYVLFAGLVPLAAVEAKRKNVTVSGSLQQAKRYSRVSVTAEASRHPTRSSCMSRIGGRSPSGCGTWRLAKCSSKPSKPRKSRGRNSRSHIWGNFSSPPRSIRATRGQRPQEPTKFPISWMGPRTE